MKKILLFFISIWLLSSCAYTPAEDIFSIPTSVYETMNSQTVIPDTLYVVKTEFNHFYFNQEKQLVHMYETAEKGVFFPDWIVVVAILVIAFLLGLVTASVTKS